MRHHDHRRVFNKLNHKGMGRRSAINYDQLGNGNTWRRREIRVKEEHLILGYKPIRLVKVCGFSVIKS